MEAEGVSRSRSLTPTEGGRGGGAAIGTTTRGSGLACEHQPHLPCKANKVRNGQGADDLLRGQSQGVPSILTL